MFKFKFHVELARRPCLHKKQYMYTYVKIDALQQCAYALQARARSSRRSCQITMYLKHAPREYAQYMYYSM